VTKGGELRGPPDGGGGISSLLFGKFPKWFLLSCFAKKVSKEREKGENSRAHSRGAKETSPFNPSARNDEK